MKLFQILNFKFRISGFELSHSFVNRVIEFTIVLVSPIWAGKNLAAFKNLKLEI